MNISVGNVLHIKNNKTNIDLIPGYYLIVEVHPSDKIFFVSPDFATAYKYTNDIMYFWFLETMLRQKTAEIL